MARCLWNQARRWQSHYYDHYGSIAPWTQLQQALRQEGSTYGLHDRCFSYTIRRFNANLRVWYNQRRRQPHLQPPGYAYQPQPLLFEVGRNAAPIGPWTYRLTVLSEDRTDRHALVKLQLRPGVKMAQVKSIQIQPNLKAIVTYRRFRPPSSPGAGIAGIDLGIANLAAVAFQSGECILYRGQTLLALERQARERSARLEKTSARYRAIWSRVRDIRRLALHQLTNSIIRECLARQVGTMVVGDLKHIRQNKRQQAVRMWAFGRVVEQLTYKGLEYGLKVIRVSEAYTSRRCHWCDGPGRRTQRQRQFRCSVCGRQIDADVGASFKILSKKSPLPVYAWGIPPAVGEGDDLPIIGPTHRADFTGAYTIRITPVTVVEPFKGGNLFVRPSYPGQPDLAAGSKGTGKAQVGYMLTGAGGQWRLPRV